MIDKTINKITEFWQTLDAKQQIYGWVFTVGLLLLLLVTLLYLPLNAKNQALKERLHVQNTITQKLLKTQRNPSFLKVDGKNFKSIVMKSAQQKRLKIDLSFTGKQLSLQGKNQAFKSLNSLLSSLRRQYAITTTQANITRIRDGFVDVKLRLKLP